MNSTYSFRLILFGLILALLFLTSLTSLPPSKKIGVLLVNHGSRSITWRSALLDLEDNVRAKLLENQNIKGLKTAFMEYNEPCRV